MMIRIQKMWAETSCKKKWEILALIIILSLGIFLRAYHFSDWLHFEIDQAYDFNLVSPAITDGIANLPLLGPNVGGGLLRLGPAFYYMEYVSALLFGNTPTGHASFVLILSLLSLPLFYAFCRKYFSVYEALGLLVIFSTSLFSVLYARFSWSPNVLPFLTLLSFYALLRSVSIEEKYPARWFLLAVASVTITSQIHFNSFFAVPLIALAFVIIKRPRFHWKVWLSALAIIFFIYSPVIANDIHTNKENLHYLKQKLLKTTPSITSPAETLSQDVLYNAYEYFFITTGNDQINGMKLRDYGFSCGDCKNDLPLKIGAVILFLASSLFFFSFFWKEKNQERKDFLLLVGLWFLVSLALFYTVAQGYRMYPRFFLIASPLAIIWYGFLFRLLKSEQNKIGAILFGTIILILAGMNIQKIIPIFDQLKSVPYTENKNISVSDIFPETDRLTFEEEQLVVDYITSRYETNHSPVYLGVKSEYKLALWSLLEQRGIAYYDEMGDDTIFAEGNYFDIKFSNTRANSDPKFTILETKNFGTLTVYTLDPLASSVIGTRQPSNGRKQLEEMAILSKLLTWKSLLDKR